MISLWSETHSSDYATLLLIPFSLSPTKACDLQKNVHYTDYTTQRCCWSFLFIPIPNHSLWPLNINIYTHFTKLLILFSLSPAIACDLFLSWCSIFQLPYVLFGYFCAALLPQSSIDRYILHVHSTNTVMAHFSILRLLLILAFKSHIVKSRAVAVAEVINSKARGAPQGYARLLQSSYRAPHRVLLCSALQCIF